MTKADIVNQIKALFSVEVQVEDKPVVDIEKEKMAEAVLKNGVKIMTPEEFEVGAEVFVVGEDGENLLAPDGQHELEDGTIVETLEGKITQIMTVEDEAETELGKDKEKMNVSVEEFSKLKEKVSELEDKLANKEDNFKAVKEATILLAEEFAKMPGAEKVNVEKASLVNDKPISKEEKFIKILKSIKN
jgi:hypothetical protein